MMTVFSGFGAGVIVMLLGAGAVIAQGADGSGRGGALPALSGPVRHPVAVFNSLASRTATFSPDLYYHLALGTAGAGDWSGLAGAIDVKGPLVKPAAAAVPHFRPSMQPGSSFNWGHVKPTFNFAGNHFYLPAKALPSVEVAGQPKPSAIQFPDVPTLNQKAPGPTHILDDPKNAVAHRLP
jgi:hypothetical protein